MARTSTLIYGQPGAGKTSLLYSFMLWLRSIEPNAVARLVSCENWATIEDAVQKGWVIPWNPNRWDHPFETLERAALGYWPEDVNKPNSRLIPPTVETFDTIRATFFEGMSTMGDYMIGSYSRGAMADRAARGEDIKAREDSARFMDGSTPVGGNARTDYSIVQRRMHSLVVISHDLPCHLIWTAHETQGTNDQGKPIYGPEIVGTAATNQAARWFANVLHATTIAKRDGRDGAATPEHRLYIQQHYDPENPNNSVPFKAKPQIRVQSLSEVDKKAIPPYFAEGDQSLVKFYNLIDRYCGIPAYTPLSVVLPPSPARPVVKKS